MRFRKVFFIIPDPKGAYGKSRHPPVGVGYLTETLTENSICCKVLDMTLGYSVDYLFSQIHKFNPDLICISMHSFRFQNVYNLIDSIKKRFQKPIAVGGPHVSLFKSEVLDCCCADFAVKNEGEIPLLRLCMGDDLAGIDGLIYRDCGVVVENRDAGFVKDLDLFPFPRYGGFQLDGYLSEVGLISSRGCCFNCSYCPVKTSMGCSVRMRSSEKILEELVYWRSQGVRTFDFYDDAFTYDKNRIFDLCDLIEEERLSDLILRASNGIRADAVDRDLLSRMRDVGFQYINFGVESADNHVLAQAGKGETIEQIDESVGLASTMGFGVGLFFMVGLPGDTYPGFLKSVDFAKKHRIHNAFFYNIIPFPKTRLYAFLAENNYLNHLPDHYLNNYMQFDSIPLFETPEFPTNKRMKALKARKKIQHKLRLKNLPYILRNNFDHKFISRKINARLDTYLNSRSIPSA
jgi:anaerobic magnesium-protoporphyrin IX monomethyl ester cyclase